jgi:hypothetical protein
MNKKIYRFLITILVMFPIIPLYAQGPPPPPPGPTVPIDGGLSILLAAGALLGIRKFIKNRHK